MQPSTSRWLSVVLLVVILGAGVGIGVALDRLWLRPAPEASTRDRTRRARGTRDPAKQAERLTRRFQKKLGLDETQAKAVRVTLEQMFAKTRELRKQRRTELRQVRDTYRAAIQRVLTPAQRDQFRKMVDSYEKRRKQRRR